MKEFNVTGTCIADKHYMVSIDDKIDEIIKLINKGKYFSINRPRQYGKTTTMHELSKAVSEKYIVMMASFEGVGDDMFRTEERFCSAVFEVFARSFRFKNKDLYNKLKYFASTSNDFNKLSDNITDFIEDLDKDVILMIDEVDKSSVNRVFMQFLGMLRSKYLAMSTGNDRTFKSVILSGVHDIKNLKLKIRDHGDKVFNSPWNIAADFKIDMSFSSKEIKTMLDQYVNETGISMDTDLISKEISKFTGGYPYLVSRLCKNIDEYLNRNWTLKGVVVAVKMTLNERSTLFDDVIKNIENNKDVKAVVYEMLVEGREIPYNPIAYEKGVMYGILKEINNKIAVHNKIFENLIYDYLIAQEGIRKMLSNFTDVNQSFILENNKLNIEKVLIKFQEFMYQEYRQKNEKFYETNGRLLFLAFLKPILNGRGFSFVEVETRGYRRMDVVITFGNEKFIVELKIWSGKKYEEKGLEQLAGYLEAQALDVGYMLIFNFNKNKEYKNQWITFNGKKIFEVIL